MDAEQTTIVLSKDLARLESAFVVLCEIVFCDVSAEKMSITAKIRELRGKINESREKTAREQKQVFITNGK